jgi:hypothetical protein
MTSLPASDTEIFEQPELSTINFVAIKKTKGHSSDGWVQEEEYDTYRDNYSVEKLGLAIPFEDPYACPNNDDNYHKDERTQTSHESFKVLCGVIR